MEYALNELIPKSSEFYLSAKHKTYILRPLSLADEAWILETFGELYKEMLMGKHLPMVARAIFHQMTEDGKKDFPYSKVKIVNEKGQSEETELGGYLLFMSLISGPKEKSEILMAYRRVVGLSSPKPDPKKKVPIMQKLRVLIGLEFST